MFLDTFNSLLGAPLSLIYTLVIGRHVPAISTGQFISDVLNDDKILRSHAGLPRIQLLCAGFCVWLSHGVSCSRAQDAPLLQQIYEEFNNFICNEVDLTYHRCGAPWPIYITTCNVPAVLWLLKSCIAKISMLLVKAGNNIISSVQKRLI